MELTVEKRDKSQNPHTLRGKGVLPAVIYGRSEEATSISIDMKQFQKVYKAAGESGVISLTGLGTAKEVLIKEVAFDVMSGFPIHADFYAIQKGQTVTVSIPLEFDGVSPAVKDLGGILTKVIHEVEIECEPKDLPQAIHVDISKLTALDSQILVSDLTFPKSAKVSLEPEDVVAIISVVQDEADEPAVPTDLSSIEISEERGKKEEEDAPAADTDSE